VNARVEVSDDAQADIAELYKEDTGLALEALRQIKRLEQQPYAGDKLREKSNRKPLAEADCRKLKFDHPDRPARTAPRYRIVYPLEPGEGSPESAYIIIVAAKREAYGAGTARAARRMRELARERARSKTRRES
jgi:hypothetical protein